MPESDASFRGALRVREFRFLWLAGAQSSAGDQLARIAIVLLVYARSGSAAISAVTYALTFLPSLLGGVFLSGLADRYPRRTVMVTCDLIRLVLLAILASVHVTLPVLDALLVLIVLVGAPFSSAAVAVGPEVLPAEHYVAGVSLNVVTGQLAQLIAFAAGGLCVSFLGVRTTLLLDSATFGLSACLIRCGMAYRPAPMLVAAAERAAGSAGSYLGRLGAGVRVVFGEPLLRTLVLFGRHRDRVVAVRALGYRCHPDPHDAQAGRRRVRVTGRLLVLAEPAGVARPVVPVRALHGVPDPGHDTIREAGAGAPARAGGGSRSDRADRDPGHRRTGGGSARVVVEPGCRGRNGRVGGGAGGGRAGQAAAPRGAIRRRRAAPRLPGIAR